MIRETIKKSLYVILDLFDFKRLLDLTLSVVAVILLFPFLLIIAVLVRFKLGSPVIFKQKRAGRHGEPFTILKFRTMTDERDQDGILLPDEKRLTRLGNFLRNTSLDELPELFNVIIGDMSLVGPRPLFEQYLPYYTQREALRHKLRPGITGWAQINGRNFLSWSDRLELDVWYLENRSLFLDLKILFLTVGKVLAREGVAADPDKAERYLDEERRCDEVITV